MLALVLFMKESICLGLQWLALLLHRLWLMLLMKVEQTLFLMDARKRGMISYFKTVRFELAFYALNPIHNVVSPRREWEIIGQEDAIEYAQKHNVPVPVTKKSIYSRDVICSTSAMRYKFFLVKTELRFETWTM